MDSLQLYIPNNAIGLLTAEGGLKSPPEADREKLLFFVGYLSLHVLKEDHKIKRHEYVNLHSSECQLVLGKAFKQKVFIPLQDAGVLDVYDSYIAGARSKGYRLSKPFRDELVEGRFKIRRLNEGDQLNRFNRWIEKRKLEAVETYPSVIDQLEHMKCLSFDKAAILDELVTIELSGVYKGKKLDKARHMFLVNEVNSLIELFDSGDFQASLSKGRIHHHLTNAPKLFRKHIYDRHDNAMEEIDMNSAQLVFLCAALLNYFELALTNPLELKKHIHRSVQLFMPSVGLPSDVLPFFSNVIHQDFYSDMKADRLYSKGLQVVRSVDQKLEGPERDDLKRQAFKDVLFTNSTKHPKDSRGKRRAVYDCYPTVMSFIHDYNETQMSTKKRSRGLAILLQEMEGYFYNGVIAPTLQDRFPDGDWFIVYDAVFASSEISEEVHSLLNEICLRHFGLRDLFSL
jgi:hypothetical protein